jgi:antitoxin YefM
MKTISYTSARANLAKTMQKVCEDHAPYIITRASEEPVVMISLADYEALQETHYLMKSPANAARLAESIDEIEQMIKDDKAKK